MKMTDGRRLLRMAGKLFKVLDAERPDGFCGLGAVDAAASRLESYRRRFLLARGRKLSTAAADAHRDVMAAAHRLRAGLSDWIAASALLAERNGQLLRPALGGILDDLRALHGEPFRGFELDGRLKSLAVLTDRITLSDGDVSIGLGAYRITLDLDDLASDGGEASFDIESVDGVSSHEKDDVCHPHVRDGRLCSGKGHDALQSALVSGRLYDAFCTVNTILHTYNGDSPHVMLSEWKNGPEEEEEDDDRPECPQCNERVDETFDCEDCGDEVCDGCQVRCPGCRKWFCGGCREKKCQDCENRFCGGCVEDCTECGKCNCENCGQDCSGCGGNTCSGCAETCVGCGKGHCFSCLDKVNVQSDGKSEWCCEGCLVTKEQGGVSGCCPDCGEKAVGRQAQAGTGSCPACVVKQGKEAGGDAVGEAVAADEGRGRGVVPVAGAGEPRAG